MSSMIGKLGKFITPGATPSDVAALNFSTLATSHNEENREGAGKAWQNIFKDTYEHFRSAPGKLIENTISGTRNALANTFTLKDILSGPKELLSGIGNIAKWIGKTAMNTVTAPIALAGNTLYQAWNLCPSFFPIRVAVIGVDYASIIPRKISEYAKRTRDSVFETLDESGKTISNKIDSTRESIFNTIAGPQMAKA